MTPNQKQILSIVAAVVILAGFYVWGGKYLKNPSPASRLPLETSSPARGEEDKEVTVIREIVLRDIQVIERAVPGPVGPVGRPGKDGKDGRDGQNGLNGTNGNNGLSTPAEAGVHSPNEDLDSRLPLGHELEVE